MPRINTEEDFERFVDVTPSCWLWTGCIDGGYGVFTLQGRRLKAHRIALNIHEEDFKTSKRMVDHKFVSYGCPRNCVNPAHLQIVTHKQNRENLAGAYKNNSSGVRGVNYHKRTGKWRARVGHEGKVYYLGLYETKEEASEVAKAKRLELHTNNIFDRENKC